MIGIHDNCIVFVEVKAKATREFGEPFEMVTREKKHNIVRGAKAYLKQHNFLESKSRIDVISVVDDVVVHIENAVELN